MPIYKVQMPDGSENTIVAEQDFIDQYFPGGELMPEPVANHPPPEAQMPETGAPESAPDADPVTGPRDQDDQEGR